MNNISKLIKHVREAAKFFSLFYVLLCVSLWLSHIHYVYKVPYYSLQQFFL